MRALRSPKLSISVQTLDSMLTTNEREIIKRSSPTYGFAHPGKLTSRYRGSSHQTRREKGGEATTMQHSGKSQN